MSGLCSGEGHVSHLRRSRFSPYVFPTLPRWANVWRTYGAREISLTDEERED